MSVLILSKDVADMKPCMKRPIVVYALQINEDFAVETLEGLMKGQSGDYLMKGFKGELYICAKDIFERTYDFL